MVFNTGAALLDAIVLAVVSKEPEGTYGYKITQDVRGVLDISESTLYPVLRRLQKERGITYLFIAHDLSVMRYISDRIAVIHKGRIVELAGAEELTAHAIHPYTRSLLSSIPMPDPRLFLRFASKQLFFRRIWLLI